MIFALIIPVCILDILSLPRIYDKYHILKNYFISRCLKIFCLVLVHLWSFHPNCVVKVCSNDACLLERFFNPIDYWNVISILYWYAGIFKSCFFGMHCIDYLIIWWGYFSSSLSIPMSTIFKFDMFVHNMDQGCYEAGYFSLTI